MSHTQIATEHIAIRDYLSEHRLPLYFSKPVIAHIETYMVATTAKGFRGKSSIWPSTVIAIGLPLLKRPIPHHKPSLPWKA